MNFETTLWDLFRKYPQFVNLEGSYDVYRLSQQISVGRGWVTIIRNLYKALEQIGFDGHILQVKEKFGLLRIYLIPTSWGVSALIEKAIRESQTTCEKCGLTTQGSWDEETDEYIKYPYYRLSLSWTKTFCGYCYMNRKVLGPVW